MSMFTIEELNVDRLRSMVEDVKCGVETVHFLIYSDAGSDLTHWAADQLANRAADLKKLCDEVHPDPGDED